MKHVSLIITLAAVAAFGLLTGCSGGDKSKMIAKKWKMTDISTPMIDTMQADMKAKFKAQMQANTVEFKADGTMNTASGESQKSGKWKIADNMLLTKDDGADKEDTVSIVDLSDTKLVVESKMGAEKMKVTMEPAN